MPKCVILAIDGGGIRGLLAAQCLMHIETILQDNMHVESLYDRFDMLAGTSTGALIALHIAANQASAQQAVMLYNADNAKRIMNKSLWDRYIPIQGAPKYDGKGKRAVLSEVFGEKRLLEIEKPVLVTSYDINAESITVFKSWGGEHSKDNPYIRDIADASSAAPTYFPTVRLFGNPNKWLIDGGMAANNPAMSAVSAALNKGHALEDIYVLSLGTGKLAKAPEGFEQQGKASRGWGGIGWLKNGLIEHLFSGNVSATDYFCRQILAERYLRLDIALPKEDISMDDTSAKNLAKLRGYGDQLFADYQERLVDFFTALDNG